MGTWGTRIFDNDLACNVRFMFFHDITRLNLSEPEVRANLKTQHGISDSADIGGDACRFWVALALTEWRSGRLSEAVRVEAVRQIDGGGDLSMWEEPQRERRAAMLQKAKATINSPQRQPTRPRLPALPTILRQPVFDQSPFRNGDIISYADSGVSVAFWVMEHLEKEGPTGTLKGPRVQLLAVGRPDLPPVASLIRGLPARWRGRRNQFGASGFDRRRILDSLNAVGDRWSVLTNAPWDNRPYYALGNSLRGGSLLTVKKPRGSRINHIWIDDSLDYWINDFSDLYDHRSAIVAIDRLLEVIAKVGREDAAWPDVQLDELEHFLQTVRARLDAGEYLTRDDEQAWVELTISWGALRELSALDLHRLAQTYTMPASSLSEYPPNSAFTEMVASFKEMTGFAMRDSENGTGLSPEFYQAAAEFYALRPIGWEANASHITATPAGELWDEVRRFDSDFYDFLRWEGASAHS